MTIFFNIFFSNKAAIMIKTKESQGLFDYTCKQTHQLSNGKFMNNQHDTYKSQLVTSSKLKTLDVDYHFQNSNFYPAVNDENISYETVYMFDHWSCPGYKFDKIYLFIQELQTLH